MLVNLLLCVVELLPHYLFRNSVDELDMRTSVRTEHGQKNYHNANKMISMDTGNLCSKKKFRFILVFALLVALLMATRGVMGGVYEYTSNVNWVAGILFLILVSVIPIWVVFRYVNTRSEE